MNDVTQEQAYELTTRLIAPPLDQCRRWLGSFLGAPAEALDAVALGLALSHVIADGPFRTAPGFLFWSTLPESGKSSGLHAAKAAGGGKTWLVSATAATIDAIRAEFRKNYGNTLHTTLLVDEGDKKWGRTGENGGEELRGFLTDRHRRLGAFISMQVKGDPQDVPTFGMSFLAGLGRAFPKDVRSRCVRIEMTPLPPHEADADARRKSDDDATQAEGGVIGGALNFWAHKREVAAALKWFMLNERPSRIHPRLYSRMADVWMPLFAIAHAADLERRPGDGKGPTWVARCKAAFMKLALNELGSQPPTLVQWMSLDAGDFIAQFNVDRMLTIDFTRWLRAERAERWEEVSNDQLERYFMHEALGNATQLRAVSVFAGKDEKGKRAQGRFARDFMPGVQELREQLYPSAAAGQLDAHELEVMGEELTAEEQAELDAELRTLPSGLGTAA